MVSLSNSDNDSSEENVMSSDFPLYVWFVSIFNAMVFITYPLGLIAAIVAAMNAYSNAFHEMHCYMHSLQQQLQQSVLMDKL